MEVVDENCDMKGIHEKRKMSFAKLKAFDDAKKPNR